MVNLKNIGLYFITDRNLTKSSIIEDVKAAIKGGVKILQYREKWLSTKEMFIEARKIRDICRENGVLFLVNDRIDIVLGVDADGVHLGQEDLPCNIARRLLGNKIIGVTVHNIEEAIKAEEDGADYVSLSPIFPTTTKEDAGDPVGIELIKKLKSSVRIPVIAIGGINKNNLVDVIKAGADGVAAISAIIPKDVEQEVKEFVNIINSLR